MTAVRDAVAPDMPADYPMEPTTGLEPVTSSLPRKCSTAELCGQHSGSGAFAPLPIVDGGGARIRTWVGVSQRVYSPSPLTTRAHPRTKKTTCYSPFQVARPLEGQEAYYFMGFRGVNAEHGPGRDYSPRHTPTTVTCGSPIRYRRSGRSLRCPGSHGRALPAGRCDTMPNDPRPRRDETGTLPGAPRTTPARPSWA